jgi:hypothetical protein
MTAPLPPGRALAAACRDVVAASPLVALDEEAIAAVAVPEALRELPPWDDAPFAAVPDERAVSWLVAYNAINYSYWPDEGPRWYVRIDGVDVGRDDEALAVMAVLAREPVNDADWLTSINAARLGQILGPAPGAGALPMLHERAAALVELGGAIREHGPPEQWVTGSAVALVERLAARLPSWEDRRTWAGGTLRFLKRAQLCAAMVHGRLRGRLTGIEQLTAFADYRLPQILRGLGVLRLDPALAEAIAEGRVLPAGGDAEVALRAAAIDGSERIAAHTGLTPIVVDHFLWRTAVARQDELPPHHRTRCTDY